MKSDPVNKFYYLWEKDKPIADIPPDFELEGEKLLYWLYWLRGQAKEKNIWSGTNDEIAYKQIRDIVELFSSPLARMTKYDPEEEWMRIK